MDKRWMQLGEVLVNYSTGVRRGERVLIAMHEVETLPLVRAAYEAAVRAGGHVQVMFFSEHLRRSLLRWGSPEQAGWMPELEAYGMEWADVYLGLRGAHNPYEMAGVDAQAIARHQAAMGRISALRWQQTRWCLVRVPNEALAWQAHSDLESLLDGFFAACLRDWPAESAGWRARAEALGRGSTVRLVGQDTDLRFSVAGRTWVTGDGRLNMPDGEIMTAPLVESVDGYISFEQPASFGGKMIEGLRLAWQGGRLVAAESRTHQDYLEQVLASDAGARAIGEFAFGTNYGLTGLCGDPLLDEKVGGTVHIALGRAYPECGGTNQSAIHWDIVKDLRAGGTVCLDGKVVFADGQFAGEQETCT